MKLLFSNSYGIERIIGEPNCLSEAIRIISDFLEDAFVDHTLTPSHLEPLKDLGMDEYEKIQVVWQYLR